MYRLIRSRTTCALAFASLIIASGGVGGCSQRSTPVLPEVWADDAVDNGAFPTQLLAPAEKPFVAPGPARTVIALTPGIYVRVAPASKLTITDVGIEEDGNETAPGAMTLRKAELELRDGELCAYLPADDAGGESKLVIHAAGAVISGGQGSLLFVRITSDELRITCVRGDVELSINRERQALAAGSYVSLPGRVTQPRVITAAAAEDSTAQNDIDIALTDESLIRELVRAHASHPAPWTHK